MEAARQRLAEGLPDEAESFLAKVLQAEPANKQALALEQQVNAEKAERQKRARIVEGLRQARELWTQQNYNECIQLLVNLEKEFPGEEEVSKQLESAREDQIEQQKQQGLLESRNLLAIGRHEECLALLTGLRRQFPQDEEIPRLLEDVRKDQLNRRRLQGLAQAKSMLVAGQYDACSALLTSLREEFPGEQEIPKLLETAAQNQAEERRQRRVAEARKHLAARQYEECMSLLVALEKEFPRDDEILKLQDAVREEQAEQRKQQRLQEVRSLLASKDYERSLALLALLQKEFPGEDEVQKLQGIARAEQAEQRKQQGLAEARRLLAAKRYDESIAVLGKLEADFPSESEIRRLLQSIRAEQVEQRKQEGLAEARGLLSAKRYDESIAVLGKLEADFPSESEIRRLLQSIREEQAEQRKQEGLAGARRLLAAKRYDESIAVLGKLQGDYPGETEIPRLLQSTREQQAEQRKQEGLAEARSLLAARRYDESIAVLQKLQADFPSELEIRNQLATAREDLAEQQKQQKLSEARSRLAAQSFGEALTVVESLARTYPKDAAVMKLRTLVEREQEKDARAKRIERELETLKKLMSEKQYPEVVSRTKALLSEFPAEANFVRLSKFAASQQAAIEREQLLHNTLEEAKALFGANRFEEAARTAQNGLRNFPGNVELLNLSQQAEIQQRKLEIRQQIEMRIREIRVKINREELSEAIDLAKQTLVTLGPDTDLTQLLNSAQVESKAREKKREQEKAIGTIRTLVESGKFDAATLVVEEALKTNVIEAFDPRIQRLTEQIKDAKSVAERKSAPTSLPAAPPSVSREYAFLQAAPLPSPPPPAGSSSLAPQAPLGALTEQASAAEPALSAQPVVPVAPLDVVAPPPATVVQPPEAGVAEAARESGVTPDIPARPMEAPKDRPPAAASASTWVARPAPVGLPTWRKPALLVVLALGLVAAIWAGVHASRSKAPQVSAPVAKTNPEPPAPRVDPLEVQQRDALDAANKLIAANDLEGALQRLQQGAALKGPLTSEIDKKVSAIAESMKDANLRALRQREAVLWQQATNRLASGRLTDAQKELRQILALPVGGVHREEAQNYLDKVIPQRILQNDLLGQGRQSLKQGDFPSARRAAGQLKQNGGDPAALIGEIDQAEQSRLAQLESQFNQLKQRDDDAAIQQLKVLQPKFQALANDGGSQSAEALNYANNIPATIADVQARVQKKIADAAFQQMVQRYQLAVSANDKNGLTAARTDFESVIQSGGPHAEEAQKHLLDVNNKLAALNQPVVPESKPPIKAEVPPSAPANADADVRVAVQRYAEAFNHRDVDALRQVWPTMGPLYARLKVSFESASSIREQVDIQSVDLSTDGTNAVVKGQVSQLYTPKGAKTKGVVKSASTFHLAKSNSGTWVITDVQ